MAIKKIFRFALVPALALGLLAGVAGTSEAARADRRQGRQATRIHRGVAEGSLTKTETASLLHQQARIQATKRRARADGKVTQAERRRIQRKQNAASRDIAKKKHNKRRRARRR